MLRLTHDEEPASWDRLAAEIGGSFFHCHAFATFEARTANARPLFVRIADSTGKNAGVAVGTVRSPSIWPHSRFCKVAQFSALPACRPHSGVETSDILYELESALRRIGVYRYGVSGFDSRRSAEVLDGLCFELRNRVEFYVDLRRSRDDLFGSFSGTRRNDVRRAERKAVRTEIVDNLRGCELLVDFQRQSLRHHRVEARSEAWDELEARFIKELLCDTDRGRLMVSYLGDEPISASLFGVFNRTAYYVYSGTSSLGKKSGGPVHLLWTAMTSFMDEGIEHLNLGGCRRPEGDDGSATGLYKFKKNFGGEEVEQPAGTKVISPLGHRLSRLRSSVKGIMGRKD